MNEKYNDFTSIVHTLIEKRDLFQYNNTFFKTFQFEDRKNETVIDNIRLKINPKMSKKKIDILSKRSKNTVLEILQDLASILHSKET